jgi:RNA recognition motif-containing protein
LREAARGAAGRSRTTRTLGNGSRFLLECRKIRAPEKSQGEHAISSKVFVGNLSYEVTREELLEAFGAAGKVLDAKIPTDRATGRPRGFAFVEFEKSEDAQRSIEMLNGKDMRGRSLRVNAAEDRPPRPPGAGEGFRPRPGGGGGFGPRDSRPRSPMAPRPFGPPFADAAPEFNPRGFTKRRGTRRDFEKKKREGGERIVERRPRPEDIDDFDEE